MSIGEFSCVFILATCYGYAAHSRLPDLHATVRTERNSLKQRLRIGAESPLPIVVAADSRRPALPSVPSSPSRACEPKLDVLG